MYVLQIRRMFPGPVIITLNIPKICVEFRDFSTGVILHFPMQLRRKTVKFRGEGMTLPKVIRDKHFYSPRVGTIGSFCSRRGQTIATCPKLSTALTGLQPENESLMDPQAGGSAP